MIACANISNLLLSKAIDRQREIAVRTAMGATRGRLIRQLLTESVVLSIAGGLAGLAIASWGGQALVDIVPHGAPAPDNMLNWTIFGLTMALSLVSAVVFGLAPAFEVSSNDVNSTLKETGRSGSRGLRGRRFRNGLVVVEVMLTMVLLVGSGLVIRTSMVIRNLQPGFDKKGLLTLDVELPSDRYATPQQVESFYSRALTQLSAVPGVQSAAATSHVPVMNDGQSTGFVLSGSEDVPVRERPTGAHIEVSADFFRTIGLPVSNGRGFTSQDTSNSANLLSPAPKQ